MTSIDYNPSDPAIVTNPYPALALLQEHDPAHFNEHMRAWFVTRYEDNKKLTQNTALSSDRLRPFFASMEPEQRQSIGDIIRYLTRWMVFTDPPDHTRLRRITASVFSVDLMNGMRQHIEHRVDTLLDQLYGQHDIDFIADFAGPLPALVIMDMLGVPEEHLAHIKVLSDRIALFIGSARMSAQKYATAQAATQEMAAFFENLIEQRRRQPSQDLISQLIEAHDPDNNQDHLNQEELIGTCILLLFAGHETTTSLLSNGLLGMMQFPQQARLLRANPNLANDAVEEILRFDGPNLSQARVAHEPVRLHGKTIEPGDRVFLMLAAANRDPRVYEQPTHLDFERDRVAHLAFGWGKHICLGFPLARLEGQIAFVKLLERWRDFECNTDELPWHRSLVFRGVAQLPLRIDWAK